MGESQVSHTGFEGNLNTITIVTTIKDKHIIFTRVTLLMQTKASQEKVPFRIFSIQMGIKKIKPKKIKREIYTKYGRFIFFL